MIGWMWFAIVQLIMLIFTVLGWVLLIPACLLHAWDKDAKSIKDGRPIDTWIACRCFNAIYGNPEDGVSGQCALVWVNGVNSPYMPLPPFVLPLWQGKLFVWFWDAWRAYCWSALRNSCDALKYRFAWANGPQATILGRKVGWWEENGRKVPIL